MNEPEVRSIRRKFTPEEAARFEAGQKWAEENMDELRRDARARFEEMEAAHRMMQRLRRAREEKGIALADLAARTGLDASHLARMETDINAAPDLATLLRLAHGLGGDLDITFRDAA